MMEWCKNQPDVCAVRMETDLDMLLFQMTTIGIGSTENASRGLTIKN